MTLSSDSLARPVTPAELGSYYQRNGIPRGQRIGAMTLRLGVTFLLSLAILIFITKTLLAQYLPDTALLGPLAGVAVLVFGTWFGLVALRLVGDIRNSARVERLACANGWRFIRNVESPNLAGSAFRVGTSRTAFNVIDAQHDDPGFIAGSFRFVTRDSFVNFSFATLTLARAVPHIVLANRRVGVLEAASAVPANDQRLSLEGNFDQTFSLSCPKGYERDALYLFTPDLMALS